MKYPRRSQYPKELIIGRRTWAVVFCDAVPDGDPSWHGYCWEYEDTIYLVKGYSPRNTFETFIHEIMHALEYTWNIKIPHELIYILQRPIARFVRDNFF